MRVKDSGDESLCDDDKIYLERNERQLSKMNVKWWSNSRIENRAVGRTDCGWENG